MAASSACTSIDFNYWRISCLVDNGSTNTRFNRDVKAYLCLVPILMTTLLLFGYFFYRPWEGAAHLTEARTQLLTAMILIELTNAISVRSLGHHIWQVGVFKNKIWCAEGGIIPPSATHAQYNGPQRSVRRECTQTIGLGHCDISSQRWFSPQ